MANIFKTTLKRDIITDITDNNVREVRFPITKFWATRLTNKYNLDKKEFEFKTFDSLEFSSPSNKENNGLTYSFNFVKTYVDGEEFVVEFAYVDGEEFVECIEQEQKQEEKDIDDTQCDTQEDQQESSQELYVESVVESVSEYNNVDCVDVEFEDSDISNEHDDEVLDITIDDLFDCVKQWFDDECVLDTFYSDEFVFATNARQVIVLPNGKPLGFKKTLPVNNDVQVRIEFDKSEKIYLYTFSDFDDFIDEVLKTLKEIRKNNFVFVWKKYTGIFMDKDDRIYFGIKYSTRKSIGFNRKYNVQ